MASLIDYFGCFLLNLKSTVFRVFHDATGIFFYTKMQAKRRYLFHSTVFLYHLFQASNRSSFIINISLVLKMVIQTQLGHSN